jgi:hypothetical protein
VRQQDDLGATRGTGRKVALAELTRVTDGLLLLAAPAEPSAGFESRVVARMVSATPRSSGAAPGAT